MDSANGHGRGISVNRKVVQKARPSFFFLFIREAVPLGSLLAKQEKIYINYNKTNNLGRELTAADITALLGRDAALKILMKWFIIKRG